MTLHAPQVGDPDPRKRTSPIVEADESPAGDAVLEAGVCYFNGQAFASGSYVLSGAELLLCDERGLWVMRAP